MQIGVHVIRSAKRIRSYVSDTNDHDPNLAAELRGVLAQLRQGATRADLRADGHAVMSFALGASAQIRAAAPADRVISLGLPGWELSYCSVLFRKGDIAAGDVDLMTALYSASMGPGWQVDRDDVTAHVALAALRAPCMVCVVLDRKAPQAEIKMATALSCAMMPLMMADSLAGAL